MVGIIRRFSTAISHSEKGDTAGQAAPAPANDISDQDNDVGTNGPRDEFLHRELIDNAAAGLVVLDRTGVVRFANPWVRRMLGEDLVGSQFAGRFREDSQFQCAAFIEELAGRSRKAGPALFTGDATRPDGSVVILEVRGVNALEISGVQGVLLALADATAWILRERELIAHAHHDGLTGLPNRVLFLDRLRQAVHGRLAGAVVLIDLDHFKNLNDIFGHDFGDMVLVQVAQRLVAALRPSDTVARLGGDEFSVLLPGIPPEDARGIVEHILLKVAGKVDIQGKQIPLPTLSAGIAFLDGSRADELLRFSDVAMYAAKTRGRNQVAVYGDDVRKYAGNRRELTARISALSEINAKLHKEARTDQLTGLPNRRAFAETIGNKDTPWESGAFLFVDLDKFSDYNHRYGDYPAGDEALVAAGAALIGVCRGNEPVFRKGGEEFIVVLPDANGEMAKAVGQRICNAILALGIVHSGLDHGVLSATVGVSCGVPGRTVGQCLAEAGDLVMAAKLQGLRNRVHVAK